MESTKLTLSVKSYSLPLVKKYAKSRHTSVSKLVQDFFDDIVKKEEEHTDKPTAGKINLLDVPADLLAITGILKGKLPDDINLEDAKYAYLKEKYDL